MNPTRMTLAQALELAEHARELLSRGGGSRQYTTDELDLIVRYNRIRCGATHCPKPATRSYVLIRWRSGRQVEARYQRCDGHPVHNAISEHPAAYLLP